MNKAHCDELRREPEEANKGQHEAQRKSKIAELAIFDAKKWSKYHQQQHALVFADLEEFRKNIKAKDNVIRKQIDRINMQDTELDTKEEAIKQRDEAVRALHHKSNTRYPELNSLSNISKAREEAVQELD